MKFDYFKPLSAMVQTRLLAMHLPSGRVWNSKTGRELWKILSVLSVSINELSSILWNLIQDFCVDTSTTLLSLWEESLGIAPQESSTIEERRLNVKAQIRKAPIVKKEEWGAILTKAFGYTVNVYPALEFIADTDFYLPNPVPTPLYLVHPDNIPQNRFVVVVDPVYGEDNVKKAEEIIKRFIPKNVYAIIIDRDLFF